MRSDEMQLCHSNASQFNWIDRTLHIGWREFEGSLRCFSFLFSVAMATEMHSNDLQPKLAFNLENRAWVLTFERDSRGAFCKSNEEFRIRLHLSNQFTRVFMQLIDELESRRILNYPHDATTIAVHQIAEWNNSWRSESKASHSNCR